MNRRKPEQIVQLLHKADGKTIEDICREHQISPATYHHWKQKYGGSTVQDAKRLKELELENAKLKRLLAESMLANDALQEFLSKKVGRQPRDISWLMKWRAKAYPDVGLPMGRLFQGGRTVSVASSGPRSQMVSADS